MSESTLRFNLWFGSIIGIDYKVLVMKISVITPNFNGERFLEETIRSVISQRNADVDIEYIFVDG